MYKKKYESIDHLVSDFPNLIPIEYSDRYDKNKTEHYINLEICNYYGILGCEKWYKLHPEPVIKAKRTAVFWFCAIALELFVASNL